MVTRCIKCNRRLPNNSRDTFCADCKLPANIKSRRKKCRKCGKKLILTGIADGVLCPDCRNHVQ